MSKKREFLRTSAYIPPIAKVLPEHGRLGQVSRQEAHWMRWGPYLSERQWGTVREDYSPDGNAWSYFPHEHARMRAYRWGEDGLAGISDNHQRLCFALALWNGRDPILKERLFGLTGPQGNHGEDVKEVYYYLDSLPTHSYMRWQYKYPLCEYPYERLLAESRRRSRTEPEFEIQDTGAFDDQRYVDVFVDYAKGSVDDVCVRVTCANRGPEPTRLWVLPTLWFRNTWTWDAAVTKPLLEAVDGGGDEWRTVAAWHPTLGRRWLYAEGGPEVVFTENESNTERLGWGRPAPGAPRRYSKDAFHDFVVHGDRDAVNPARTGTKAAPVYVVDLPPGAEVELRLRLTDIDPERAAALPGGPFGLTYDTTLQDRKLECDDFYDEVTPADLDADRKNVMRQAFAGLLWTKQYFFYDVRTWLHGDTAHPPPPKARLDGRNASWSHLYNDDVISMPDKWEYPWYAAWDLAFHCVAFALVDAHFAKQQLRLMLREWYMHPNGQIPAYEWNFSDVNPPVHAWAAWRVYKIEQRRTGKGDLVFLEQVFHKLLINFTWWINRKDAEGNNLFQGGFLGLDNIGVFDRSAQLPTGGTIEQSDATSWMAMYCLNLLAIAVELARHDKAYEDVASKFFEHFMYIAHAMNTTHLWDEKDGFFYDVLALPDGKHEPMRVRSMVGLIPLFAVESISVESLAPLPQFRRRLDWFVKNRRDLHATVAKMAEVSPEGRHLLCIVGEDRLRRVLDVMLDEAEFLSGYGIRSLSKAHEKNPYVLEVKGVRHEVRYDPAESSTGMFGGNSNWRGPIWFPMNYLIIEALQKYHFYFGERFQVEFPKGSGKMMHLGEVAAELSGRLIDVFARGPDGRRPVNAGIDLFDHDPAFRDGVLFYEYFHGDTGAGLGASHQTGWTALVAKLIQQAGRSGQG
ncbi:MAG: glucosidase [Myxococcales bacterium]|nr:glucosidase [Myxococcales bacterium]